MPPPEKKPKPSKIPWQEWFPTLMSYFTKDERARMTKPTLDGAMELLSQRILALGGIHISEPCFAQLTGLLLFVCNLGKASELMKNKTFAIFKARARGNFKYGQTASPILGDAPIARSPPARSPGLVQVCVRRCGPDPFHDRLSQCDLATCAMQSLSEAG